MEEFNVDNKIVLEAFKLDPLFKGMMELNPTEGVELLKELTEKYGHEYVMNFVGAFLDNYEKAKKSNMLKDV
jgi:hypothetical protein